MEYSFDVLETVVMRRVYVVEADSESEARSLALAAETVAEQTVKTEGVINREIIEE